MHGFVKVCVKVKENSLAFTQSVPNIDIIEILKVKLTKKSEFEVKHTNTVASIRSQHVSSLAGANVGAMSILAAVDTAISIHATFIDI